MGLGRREQRIDMFQTEFLETDLVSSALKQMRSEHHAERLSAASLLAAIFREQAEKRNSMILNVLEELKVGVIEER